LVIDGADQVAAESLRREVGGQLVVVPDPTGAISDQLGIGMWPTTIMLNRAGIVSAIQFGVAGRRDDKGRRRGEALHGGDVVV
jgi:hypothetical protein